MHAPVFTIYVLSQLSQKLSSSPRRVNVGSVRHQFIQFLTTFDCLSKKFLRLSGLSAWHQLWRRNIIAQYSFDFSFLLKNDGVYKQEFKQRLKLISPLEAINLMPVLGRDIHV